MVTNVGVHEFKAWGHMVLVKLLSGSEYLIIIQ